MEDSDMPLCPSIKRVEYVRTGGQSRWITESRLIWKLRKRACLWLDFDCVSSVQFIFSFMQCNIRKCLAHNPWCGRQREFFWFRQIPMSLSSVTQCKIRKKLVLAWSCVFKNNLNDPLLKVWKGSSVIKIQTYFILDCTQTDRVKLEENPLTVFFFFIEKNNKTKLHGACDQIILQFGLNTPTMSGISMQ